MTGVVLDLVKVPFKAVSFQIISGVGVGEGEIRLLIFKPGKATGKTTPPKPKAREKAIKETPNTVNGLILSLRSIWG